jgi:hypothetical protein
MRWVNAGAYPALRSAVSGDLGPAFWRHGCRTGFAALSPQLGGGGAFAVLDPILNLADSDINDELR